MIIRKLFLGLLVMATAGIQGANLWQLELPTAAAPSTKPLCPDDYFRLIKTAVSPRVQASRRLQSTNTPSYTKGAMAQQALQSQPSAQEQQLEKELLNAEADNEASRLCALIQGSHRLNHISDRTALTDTFSELDVLIKDMRSLPTVNMPPSDRTFLEAFRNALIKRYTSLATAIHRQSNHRPQPTTSPIGPRRLASAPAPRVRRQPQDLTGIEALVGSI